MQLNINTDAAVVFTAKLEKLHRSALPVAIRQSLNSAAFDVKKDTMPKSAANEFTQRKKNFFRATSRVEMAKGFDIKSMSAKVGFIGGGTNQAVRDLEEQEYGGKIGGRAFVPLDEARVSKSYKRSISKRNQLKNIRGIDRIRNKKEFYPKVNKVGTGGHILYKGIVFFVRNIKGSKIDLTPLYSYKQGRSIKVNATMFMRSATLKSGNELEKFYQTEARKQIARLKK